MQNPETRANDGAGTQESGEAKGTQAMERGLAWLEKVNDLVKRHVAKQIDDEQFHSRFDQLLDEGKPSDTLRDVQLVCENASAALPLLAVHALKTRIYETEHARRNPKRAD